MQAAAPRRGARAQRAVAQLGRAWARATRQLDASAGRRRRQAPDVAPGVRVVGEHVFGRLGGARTEGGAASDLAVDAGGRGRSPSLTLTSPSEDQISIFVRTLLDHRVGELGGGGVAAEVEGLRARRRSPRARDS